MIDYIIGVSAAAVAFIIIIIVGIILQKREK